MHTKFWADRPPHLLRLSLATLKGSLERRLICWVLAVPNDAESPACWPIIAPSLSLGWLVDAPVVLAPRTRPGWSAQHNRVTTGSPEPPGYLEEL